MSANNYTDCPQCQKLARQKQEQAIAKAEASYGKVTPAQYAALVADAKVDLTRWDTLRENYEVGIHHGIFVVRYNASCEECGFEHFYKHEAPVKLD